MAKLKVYIKVVSCCGKCPNLYDTPNEKFCNATNKDIDNLTIIPEWCPLVNVNEPT